eukprot:m.74857 g.74857  ORF g.74857 m.74857 type:complete len:60 (+) comp14385_c1_seq3:1375-1554(+)
MIWAHVNEVHLSCLDGASEDTEFSNAQMVSIVAGTSSKTSLACIMVILGFPQLTFHLNT